METIKGQVGRQMADDALEVVGKLESISDRIILKPAIFDITGLGERSLKDLELAGRFPKRLRIGRRRVGWRLSEVASWMTTLEQAPISEDKSEGE